MTDKARLVLLPAGWMPAPKEATAEMLDHVLRNYSKPDHYRSSIRNQYRELLSAVPSLPEPDTAGSREQFEALVAETFNYGYSFTRRSDYPEEYQHDATDSMWILWQAAEARMQARNADLLVLLGDAIGCFDAADAEGLAAALQETTDRRLHDLVTRRLLWADVHLRQARAIAESSRKQGG